MTPEDLTAIEQRASAATPGPWRLDHGDVIADEPGVGAVGIAEVIGVRDTADAVFIAKARSDVPALLAEVRRLQAENDAVKSQCRLMLQQREEYSTEPRLLNRGGGCVVGDVRRADTCRHTDAASARHRSRSVQPGAEAMTPRERLKAWLESSEGDPCHAGSHLGYERYGSMKVGISDGLHYPVCSAEEVLAAFDALDPALQDEFVEGIVECPA